MEVNLKHADEGLLTEIRDLLQEQNKKSRERTVLLRIAILFLLGMLVALAIVFSTIIPKLTGALDSIHAAVATIDAAVGAIDTEQIQSLIEETERFAQNSGVMIEQAETVLSGIASVDFASLNSALADLEEAVDNFATLDMETLNRAIENLNATIEPMAKFLKRFS